MNVKELREALVDLPDNMEIICQKDSEGNGYSPLDGADSNGIYVPESTWAGDVYDSDWSASDAGMDEDEWKELLTLPRALILYPTN